MRESVRAQEVGKGESHSHPYHVDIQVGSCIFLNVFMLNHCASYLLVCLILFPSVGITVVQLCNTVGIHRSFPQGVV